MEMWALGCVVEKGCIFITNDPFLLKIWFHVRYVSRFAKMFIFQ